MMRRTARKAGKLAYYYLQHPRQLLFPQRDIVASTDFGASMLCSHENYIERAILTQGCFEPESTRATQSSVREGDVTIDVGSNVGYYCLLLARCAGPAGQVHAFEPTAWAYERSLRNIALNPTIGAPITVNHVGLLAREQESVEAIESRFSAKVLARQTAEPMRFTTLDQYCSQTGIKRVDFLKIDVDGYDYQAMLGARRVLSDSDATLLCELNEPALREQGDTIEQYIALLRELGYDRGQVLDGPRQGSVSLAELLVRNAPVSLNLLLKRSAT